MNKLELHTLWRGPMQPLFENIKQKRKDTLDVPEDGTSLGVEHLGEFAIAASRSGRTFTISFRRKEGKSVRIFDAREREIPIDPGTGLATARLTKRNPSVLFANTTLASFRQTRFMLEGTDPRMPVSLSL